MPSYEKTLNDNEIGAIRITSYNVCYTKLLRELTALGIPSLLVPFPHAAADHQYKNAVALAQNGAAMVLREEELGRIERELFSLLDDGAALTRMADAATEAGRPRAAFDIAEAVIRLAEQGAGD